MAGLGRIVRTRIGPWVVFASTVAAVVYLWTDTGDQ